MIKTCDPTLLVIRTKEVTQATVVDIGAVLDKNLHHVNVLVDDGNVKRTLTFRSNKIKEAIKIMRKYSFFLI